LSGHLYSTQVVGLPGGGFVTASANKEIHFYDAERRLVKRVTNAHSHVVKKLAHLASSDLVFSAGNDGFIKSWTRRGEAVHAWQAHFSGATDKGKEHDPFIFGLCAFDAPDGSGGRVASGGEDRFLRVWALDGTLMQVRGGWGDGAYGTGLRAVTFKSTFFLLC
jgi:WD40 repeat protein